MSSYIVEAVRSPIGRKNGALAGDPRRRPRSAGAERLVARVDLDPAEIEDVQMGCVTQIGEQGWNIGRMAVLAAGWPVEVCGDDRRPAVRLVDADELQRRDRRDGRAARPRRLRRRRDDVARADGLERRLDLGARHRPAPDRACRESRPSCSRRSGTSRAKRSTRTRSSRTAARSLPRTSGTFEREIIPIDLPPRRSRAG